jgi:DNA-directed RNA polymerase specialized sigma24 family protein
MPATVTSGPGSEEFALLASQFRPELLAHCYRMLGSVQDAEDQVQEILLRAWRGYGQFEGRSSLRTWLYRIATNACLRAMENRERRPMPMWFKGRDNIGLFLGTRVLTSPGVFTLLPAAANGQPALAIYRRAEDGTRRAYGIQVLTLRAARITAVVAFLNPALFPSFGLASELPAAAMPPVPGQ